MLAWPVVGDCLGSHAHRWHVFLAYTGSYEAYYAANRRLDPRLPAPLFRTYQAAGTLAFQGVDLGGAAGGAPSSQSDVAAVDTVWEEEEVSRGAVRGGPRPHGQQQQAGQQAARQSRRQASGDARAAEAARARGGEDGEKKNSVEGPGGGSQDDKPRQDLLLDPAQGEVWSRLEYEGALRCRRPSSSCECAAKGWGGLVSFRLSLSPRWRSLLRCWLVAPSLWLVAMP